MDLPYRRKLQVSSSEGTDLRTVQLRVSRFCGDGRVGELICQYMAAGCQMILFCPGHFNVLAYKCWRNAVLSSVDNLKPD